MAAVAEAFWWLLTKHCDKSSLCLLPGKSALHWAAAVNNVEATVALLKNGANKDMQDSKVSS